MAALDSGEVRPGQVQMAEAVERAFAEGGVVAVAAGTGTGKSLAYLVPAVASGQCVVVATATKALQDQLANKDLPLVARGLGRPVNWAVLKGRSNYLCRQRLVELERLGEQQRLDAPFEGELTEVDQPADPSGLAVAERGAPEPSRGRRRAAPQRAVAARKVGEEVRSLVEWAKSTGSGDRAELSFEPSAAAWSSLSVTADECPGSRRCPSGGECFAEAARARAASADIVVVNLHLLGAHLRCGGEVLPEHDALVIDEAHELEDVLAACLGVEVSPGRLRALASAGRAALSSAGRKAQTGENTAAARSVEAVLDAAGALEAVLGGREDQRLPPGLGGEIGTQVTLSVERLDRLSEELRRAVDASGGVGAGAGPTAAARTAEGGGDASQRCLRALLGVDRCREELTACLAAGSDEVVWVSGGSRPALHSAPLEVSGVLSAQVFSRISVVLTSATMPRGLAARVGAPVDTRELDVGSPFAYRGAGAAVLRDVAARSPPPRGGGGHPRRDRGARARRRRSYPRLVHEPPGDDHCRRGARGQAALARARAGGAPQGRPLGGAQLPDGGLPVRHDELLAGSRRPGAGAQPCGHRQDPVSPPGRSAHGRPPRSCRPGGVPDRRSPPRGHVAGPGSRPADKDRLGQGRGRRARPAPRHCLLRPDARKGAAADAANEGQGGSRSLSPRDTRRGHGRLPVH